jgi:hypothetical protein
VTKGALTIRSLEGAKTAKAGEVIFLTKGTQVAYEAAEEDTEVVYVTYPHWMDAHSRSEHAALLDISPRPLTPIETYHETANLSPRYGADGLRSRKGIPQTRARDERLESHEVQVRTARHAWGTCRAVGAGCCRRFRDYRRERWDPITSILGSHQRAWDSRED